MKMKKSKGYDNTMPAKMSAFAAKKSMKMWPKFKRVF